MSGSWVEHSIASVALPGVSQPLGFNSKNTIGFTLCGLVSLVLMRTAYEVCERDLRMSRKGRTRRTNKEEEHQEEDEKKRKRRRRRRKRKRWRSRKKKMKRRRRHKGRGGRWGGRRCGGILLKFKNYETFMRRSWEDYESIGGSGGQKRGGWRVQRGGCEQVSERRIQIEILDQAFVKREFRNSMNRVLNHYFWTVGTQTTTGIEYRISGRDNKKFNERIRQFKHGDARRRRVFTGAKHGWGQKLRNSIGWSTIPSHTVQQQFVVRLEPIQEACKQRLP